MASTTEAPVGASRWTCGSHVWIGHIGTLTREGGEKREEDQKLGLKAERHRLPRGHVEGMRLPMQVQHRNQHRERAG